MNRRTYRIPGNVLIKVAQVVKLKTAALARLGILKGCSVILWLLMLGGSPKKKYSSETLEISTDYLGMHCCNCILEPPLLPGTLVVDHLLFHMLVFMDFHLRLEVWTGWTVACCGTVDQRGWHDCPSLFGFWIA